MEVRTTSPRASWVGEVDGGGGRGKGGKVCWGEGGENLLRVLGGGYKGLIIEWKSCWQVGWGRASWMG